MYSVSDETRKPIFEGVQGENESREIQFDISSWIEELGDGACTATAKRPTDTIPYPVTVTRSGNVVTWKPNSTDTAIEGIGAFQLEYSINGSIAKTRIWNTKIAPSLDPAGDPPDPYDNWLAEIRQIAADALQDAQDADASAQDAEAWAKGTKNGTPVPSTADQYENNAKYWAEQSLANQYGAYIVKNASGDIASFSDGADDVPMKSLNVTITPKQSGSGDPSPSNVRPITGWTDADVNVCAFNLFNTARLTAAQGWTESNGVCSGEVGKLYDKYPPGTSIIEFPFKPSTQYVLRFKGRNATKNSSTGGFLFDYTDGTENLVYITSTTETERTLVSYANKTVKGIRASYADEDTVYLSEIQLEEGVSPTNYVPYNGHTTPVPFGQTVYGGSVNPISGELKITQVGVDLSSLSWSGSSVKVSSSILSVVKKPSGNNIPANVIAEKYKTSAVAPIAGNDGKIGVGADGRVQCGSNETPSGLLVYELATPTTTQLTPAQVASLLGTNNVWADCGAVEVEYRADPTLAYNELAQVIVSLGGNI